MTRRESRENAFLSLFSTLFGNSIDDVLENSREGGEPPLDTFGEGLLALYGAHAAEVDVEIEKWLKDWKLLRLPKVSLAILRISVAEMLFGEDDLDSVIINEAVELAKRYGDAQEYQFVNGVLGSVARSKGGSEGTGPSAEPAEPNEAGAQP